MHAIAYEDLHTLLARLGYDDDAACYHGAVCGALCVLQPGEIDLQRLMTPTGESVAEPDEQSRRQLGHLQEQTLLSLQDDEHGFLLLLPDDETELALRVGALSAWCEGFLFGLSSRARFDVKACSEEAREIIHDLTEFTRASVGSDDDAELEEAAYAELVEYIRVGAQLIYMELRRQPIPDPRGSGAVH